VAVLEADHRVVVVLLEGGKFMINAKKLLNSVEKDKIKQLIGEIEQSSDSELIVVMTTESNQYDRAESFVGLFFGAATLTFSTDLAQSWTENSWHTSSFTIFIQVMFLFLGFIFGSLLASFFHTVRDLFVFKADKQRFCMDMAKSILGDVELKVSEPVPVLLIYISIFEKEVIVLADGLVMRKFSQQNLENVKDKLLKKFEKKQYYQGLLECVEYTGMILKEEFPSKSLKRSFHSNELLIFHPRPKTH